MSYKRKKNINTTYNKFPFICVIHFFLQQCSKCLCTSMIFNILFVFILINVTKCQAYQQKDYTLNTALDQTTKFFQKLKLNNALKGLNNNTLCEINEKIAEHVANTSKVVVNRLKKREIPEAFNKGINTLKGFQDYDQLNFSDVRDIKFFSLQSNQLIWFIAVLDVSTISVYQINNQSPYRVANYSLTTGKRIIVSSCIYGALLIVQNQDDSIFILPFSETNGNYYLYSIQDLESSNISDLILWHGMNQLYLGIASHLNISIYTWCSDYFDLVQTIPHGTKKLIPFYKKGFMYLAVTGSTTLIFKYFFRYNKFIITQRLPLSRDVSSFQIGKGHFMEHFLSLSTESSMTVYKEIHDRFIPFQQIPFGKSTLPIVSNNAILLLLLHEDKILSYQYDGWKFVDLNIKLFDIDHFQHVLLYEKELLLVKYKNGTWAMKELIWVEQKSYKDWQEEIRTWIVNMKKTAERTLVQKPLLKDPVRLLNGSINQLFVHNINGRNSQPLEEATKQYKRLISKLRNQRISLNSKLYLHSDHLTLTSLHAKKSQIKCKTMCKVNRLNVQENSHLFSKLKKINNVNQAKSFRALSMKEIKNWKCPHFSLPIEKIIINKSINGILLDDLQKNILKVVDSQHISGEHIFSSINVSNALLPLNIASSLTKVQLQMQEIQVVEFNLTGNGLLLPLHGSLTVMTGSIKAAKVIVNNNVHLQGPIEGTWKKRSIPVMTISEPINIHDVLPLESAKIENLRSQDLIDNRTGSVKEILSKLIPLNKNVSVSLTLFSEKMKWSNVTLHESQNWITANSQNTVISGRKRFLRNVEITKSSYKNLKFLEIKAPLCGNTITAPEIKTSTLTIDNITVRDLNSFRTFMYFGNLGERYFDKNLMSLFKFLNLTSETFYYNTIVKNITATYVNNLNLTELKEFANSWNNPNILRGSHETTALMVDTLQLPTRFQIDLPEIVGDIVSEQNTHLGSVNNISIDNFVANIVKLEDKIFFENITFSELSNGFTANHIYISHLPFHYSNLEENVNLYKKQISGNIEANAINLPYSFTFTESKFPLNIVVKVSTTFLSEPTVQSINNIKLKELFEQIWLTTNTTVFQGKNLHMLNASMKGNDNLNSVLNTLNSDTWDDISKRILSKTRIQEIQVFPSLNNIQTSGIIGSNFSNVKSSVPDFNNIFDNAVIRSKNQKITAKWTFDKLKIIGKLHVKRKINNMNLETDVMRFNSGEIIIAQKTTVIVLTTENLNGFNFYEWAKNALKQKESFVIIKGRKSFNTITINSINVSGTVKGQNLTEALSNSTDQIISSQKIIHGSINASIFIIDGLVNDVNLVDLINNQLKKQNPQQRIKTGIEFQNSLRVLGNFSVNGSYGNTELKQFYKNYSNIAPSTEKTKNYYKAAETINMALQNRAVYLNKIEMVKEVNIANIVNENISYQGEQCEFRNSSQFCADKNIMNVILKLNPSDFVLIKSITLEEEKFIVWITLNSVTIFLYNNVEESFYHLKGLYIPNIINAFAESTSHSLWIALRLTSQTLLVHYQYEKNLREYVLPATDVFAMSRSPNNQLLLLLSNGIWNLEGLASPQQIINISLKEPVETFNDGFHYYLKCGSLNDTTLMKMRHVGN
ncbi:uncharacterized protein LOC116426016 [Nomia melanderi]|uniref:uncharacterized protein LOC116426016 n=1 Tax=Nomia melanderi TaxID=2448451 RepID=UPI00130455C3|nr:uncharacterized protein LOC116426016 [Nomia melanderi]